MTNEEQFKNPKGEEGRKVLKEMNEHHRDLTIWGLSKIPPMHAKQILDIGCGGGNTIKMLSVKYPNAKVVGIDISEESVKATLETNSIFHKWGKVDAIVGSASELPFPEGTFDIITAVETYFFWPDLEKTLAHIVSRLKENGILCIVSEQYPTESNREELTKRCSDYGMDLVDNDTMKVLLEKAGASTETYLDQDKNWVTFLGTKKVGARSSTAPCP